MKTPEYLSLLESNLKSQANPDAAIKMSKYMKNHFEYVVSFVQENQLSGLSEREALKWMTAKGII